MGTIERIMFGWAAWVNQREAVMEAGNAVRRDTVEASTAARRVIHQSPDAETRYAEGCGIR
jgi:hypothetical protein